MYAMEVCSKLLWRSILSVSKTPIVVVSCCDKETCSMGMGRGSLVMAKFEIQAFNPVTEFCFDGVAKRYKGTSKAIFWSSWALLNSRTKSLV